MTMLLITKELAEAVVKSHYVSFDYDKNKCAHCGAIEMFHHELDMPDYTCEHTPECIVTRAKLLLEQEWGIKS